MKVRLRNDLFGAKLGNALAGSVGKKKDASRVNGRYFAANLYKIENPEVRTRYITKYAKELLKHSSPSSKYYASCKQLAKSLKKELQNQEKLSKRMAVAANKAVSSFEKSSKSFGKYPEGKCHLSNFKEFIKDREKLEKLFLRCKNDAEKKDPELVKKIRQGKANNKTEHQTFAYVENRIDSLNASRVQIGKKVNFILSANPRDKAEIAQHLYHAMIKPDCRLWFTLNEGIDRPRFWTKKYLVDLNLPENWKITNVVEKIIAEKNPGQENSPRLVESKLIASNGKIKKKIIHYHYENWEDRQPAPCEEILLTCAKIAKKHFQETKKPVGINCKGGVGRTGVLANIIYGMRHIDRALARGKSLDEVAINVTELNYDLRRERQGIVSFPPQFIQVNRVLEKYIEEQRIAK